ncbi:MAG: HAMP domain-containing sensor histidine kinase [Candidatus Thorarchaeota archaeon]
MRDAQKEPPKIGGLVERLIDLPKALTRPTPAITEGGERRKARFLRTAILTAVCVFPILQLTSNPTQGYPIYSLLAIFMAGVYLLSSTTHVRLASAITIICAASLPFVSFMLYPAWTGGELAFQILAWPVISVLLGSQLLSIRKQALLAGALFIALILASIAHPGIPSVSAFELIAVYSAIAVLLIFASWNQDFYSTGLERSNRTLESRRRELEIYTSLLRHDLGNDLQMVLGGIELAQMANGEPKQGTFLESTHAAAQRMRSLLHIFSMTEAELDTDLVTVLEKIGNRAEIAFKGMQVSINVTDDVKQRPPKYGRLVALAFENLLRNASQHAGTNPSVEIKISQSGDTLEVMFGDDGAGIDPSIRENLFEKGVSTSSESKGLGLYLTRTIIESENGTIELVSADTPGCCFLIKLPFSNGI